MTNATPIGAYRGAGRPEAAALIERAVDLVAAELGIDPVDVRRTNLIPPDAFPYETAAGTIYDIGDYATALDEALRLAAYDDLRAEQAARRARDDHVAARDRARDVRGDHVVHEQGVRRGRGGRRTARSRCTPGRRRTARGTRPRSRRSRRGVLGRAVRRRSAWCTRDTGRVRRGDGTWGSRSLQAGGSSVLEREPRRWWRRPARSPLDLLEVDEADIAVGDGGFGVAGAPTGAITWPELARRPPTGATPAGMEPGLRAEGVYREPASTFPFGTHVAVVEVDTETGDVRLVRHVAVDDCGRILNPMLVEGQVHGGLGQGIAQALYEEVRYDEAGNPMTGNLTTYLMPSAAEFPWFETARTETPTP